MVKYEHLYSDLGFNDSHLESNIKRIREHMDFYYPQEWETDKAVNLLADFVLSLSLQLSDLTKEVEKLRNPPQSTSRAVS